MRLQEMNDRALGLESNGLINYEVAFTWCSKHGPVSLTLRDDGIFEDACASALGYPDMHG